MPKSTPPRKPYKQPRVRTSNEGAWDQLRNMVEINRQQMRSSAEMSALVVRRDKEIGDVDHHHAMALLSVLLRDTKQFHAELAAIEGAIGDRRGDVGEEDYEGLMQSLQLATQLDDWSSRWNTIVAPTVEELKNIVCKELS